MSDSEQAPAPEAAGNPAATFDADLTKYKVWIAVARSEIANGSQAAGDIVNQVIKKLIDLSVEGAKVIDLCIEGDKLLEQGLGTVFSKPIKGVKVTKGVCVRQYLPESLADSTPCSGIAFPTSISVNNAVAHFSPLA